MSGADPRNNAALSLRTFQKHQLQMDGRDQGGEGVCGSPRAGIPGSALISEINFSVKLQFLIEYTRIV